MLCRKPILVTDRVLREPPLSLIRKVLSPLRTLEGLPPNMATSTASSPVHSDKTVTEVLCDGATHSQETAALRSVRHDTQLSNRSEGWGEASCIPTTPANLAVNGQRVYSMYQHCFVLLTRTALSLSPSFIRSFSECLPLS